MPLVTVALTGCAGVKFSDLERSREGIAAASPVIAALDDFRRANGQYPASLDVLVLPTEVGAAAKRVGLSYTPTFDGMSYGMGFGYPYAGVFYVSCSPTRSGREGAWVCTGK